MGNPGKRAPFTVQLEMVASGEVLHLLNQINAKVTLLAENAGLGAQLAALTEQLRGPTDALQAAVDANQPK